MVCSQLCLEITEALTLLRNSQLWKGLYPRCFGMLAAYEKVYGTYAKEGFGNSKSGGVEVVMITARYPE